MSKRVKVAVITLLLITSLTVTADIQHEQSNPDIITGLRSPFIDGIVSSKGLDNNDLGEWEDALRRDTFIIGVDGEELPLVIWEKIVKNTLYIGLSVNDFELEDLEHFTIQLDRDRDGTISPGDVRVYLSRTNIGTLKNSQFPSDIVQTITSEVFDGNDWKIPSGSADPFSYNWADIAVSKLFVFQTTFLRIEVGIDLYKIEKELPNYPSGQQFYPNFDANKPETVNYGISLDGISDQHYGYPQAPEISDDVLQPSTVTTVNVVAYDIPPFLPQVDVGVGNIIITQATQNERNEYSVIRDKEALVRVVVENNEDSFQQVRVVMKVYHYFFITLSLVDTQEYVFYASPNPHIQQYNATANFYLAPAVTDSASIAIEVEVEPVGEVQDPNPSNDKDVHLQLMTQSYPMNVYYSQMNVRDLFLPRMFVDSRIFYTNMVFPVADLNFVEVNWRDMGGRLPNVSPDSYDRKMNYYRDILISQIRASIRYGWPAPAYPDQVHGFVMNGSGRADASWAWGGGRNRVSWSGGNSGHNEMTMAHEMNHNMDGGWGKHATGFGYGCGAPDGLVSKDNEWDSLYGDNIIHDIGWNPINQLVPAGTGELMTYCVTKEDAPGKADWPTQWIGGYRWEKWVTRLADYRNERDVSPLPQLNVDQESESTVRVFQIENDEDGTRVLPSFEIPGVYISDTDYIKPLEADADLRLEVVYKNLTSVLFDFDIDRSILENYTDEPLEQTNLFSISQIVPDDGEIEEYFLYNLTDSSLLDFHEEFDHEFIPFTQYDTNFDRGKDTTVYFGVSSNDTIIHFQLMYSPDGYGLFPLGPATTAGEMDINLQGLPGGETSKIVILASDGVKTKVFSGTEISVDHKAPVLRLKNSRQFMLNPTTLDVNDPNSQVVPRVLQTVYNASVGAPVSLSFSVQNEWGHVIDNPIMHWNIYNNENTLVQSFTDKVDMSRLVLQNAGDYRAEITVEDPSTGVTSSYNIDIRVDPLAVRGTDNDLTKFRAAQSILHQSYTDTSSFTSSTSSETKTSQSEESSGLQISISSPMILVSLILPVVYRRKVREVRV